MPEREVDYLIVGGGDAGFSAARTLREEGAEGAVVIVSRDPDPPYDRTAVSKGYLGGENRTQATTLLGGDDWFAEHDVELLTRTSAMKLDTEAHTVTLANKDVLTYGKLLLATGANVRRLRDRRLRPRRHPLPARARQRRHDPRRHRERRARRARRRLLHRHRGRGDADRARPQGRDLVMQEDVTLERTFGPTAARFFQKALTDHGVEVHAGEDVERFEGADGRVTAVVTKSGNADPRRRGDRRRRRRTRT